MFPAKHLDDPRLSDISLVFEADPISVRSALQQAADRLAARHVTSDQQIALELILAEVLNNIVEHAYCEQGGMIQARIMIMADELRCEVCDWGLPMPNNRPPEGRSAAIDVPVEDLPEGGFGWFLIRSLVKDLQYRRDGPMNRLAFSFALEDQRQP